MSPSHPTAAAELTAAAAAFPAGTMPRPWGRASLQHSGRGRSNWPAPMAWPESPRTLRLDYTRLKRRLVAKSCAAAPPPPAFVEMTLDLPPTGCTGCVLAFSDARGRALRIEWDPATRQRGGGGGAQPVGGDGVIALTPRMRVWVAVAPADFRCGIDGRVLSARLHEFRFLVR